MLFLQENKKGILDKIRSNFDEELKFQNSVFFLNQIALSIEESEEF